MTSTATLDSEAERIVKDIGIPPCPTILTNLVREMRHDEPDFRRVGELISGDVGLSASLLKTVNSPFYGLRTKATTIQQALALLGLEKVANLVTGLLLRQAFPHSNSAAMEGFWDSSSRVAALSAEFAGKLGGVDTDVAYTFGLFRDCGMPVLAAHFKDYDAILTGKALGPGDIVTAIEAERYGVTHAGIGYSLASSWFLADSLCEAVQNHHEYGLWPRRGTGASVSVGANAGSGPLGAIALAAEHISVRRQGGKAAREWVHGGAAVLNALGLSLSRFEEIVASIEQGKSR
ncbi:MAG: HDOD domain-containing protein [Betaproteobacteria bacterium]|nr:HDOD domain-containing protein [Betaproteobacteria bacterium]